MSSEALIIWLCFLLPTWAQFRFVVVMASLSSPTSGPVRRASDAAGGRSVVAAPVSDSDTVNYSSKRRARVVRPGHKGTKSKRRLSYKVKNASHRPVGVLLAKRPLPASRSAAVPVRWSPSVVLCVEECVEFLLRQRAKRCATTEQTRSDDRMDPFLSSLLPSLFTLRRGKFEVNTSCALR